MKWGRPWGQYWGSSEYLAPYMQGYEPLSLPDTTFLSKSNSGVFTELDDDRGPEGEAAFTAQTFGSVVWMRATAASGAAARLGWTTRGGVEFDAELNNSTSQSIKVLFHIGASNANHRVDFWKRWNGSIHFIDIQINGGSSHTLTIGSHLSATTKRFIISWHTRPNPDTTGTSDAYESTLRLIDYATGTLLEKSVWTHALIASSTWTTMGVGAAFDGSGEWHPMKIRQVRFSRD